MIVPTTRSGGIWEVPTWRKRPNPLCGCRLLDGDGDQLRHCCCCLSSSRGRTKEASKGVHFDKEVEEEEEEEDEDGMRNTARTRMSWMRRTDW